MATRSIIAAKFDSEVDENRGIVTTYCHYDGYATGVGYTLFTEYTDDRAFEAADAGYLSSLPEYDKFESTEHANSTEPEYFDTEEEVIEYAIDSGCEYAYLWSDGEWKIANPNSEEGFVTIDPAVHMVPEWKYELNYIKNRNPDEDTSELEALIAKYSGAE
jgi:hypothetical protein